jgi:uncharacterized protein (DUF885 family)
MKSLSLGTALALLLLSGLPATAASGSGSSSSALAGRARNSNLQDLVREFGTDWSAVGRFYDLPWSETRFDRLEALFKEWKDRLAEVDFDALNQQGRIDYILMRNKVQHELAELSLSRKRLTEMEEMLSFRAPVQKLERSRWRMESVDAQAAASDVSTLPDKIKKLRERIEKGKKKKDKGEEDKSKVADDEKKPLESAENEKPKKDEVIPLKLSPQLAKRTAAAVNDIRGSLKTWFGFYDGYQPDFSWWVKKPYTDASTALEELSKFLREEIAGLKGKDEDPLIGDPIGTEALREAIAAEMLPYTAEELIEIGEREFAWCEKEMKKAAAEMSLGEDWKAALVKVKSDFVPPGKQDDFVTEQGRIATKFVKERDLVTVSPMCEELWRLSMVSPDGQKTLPYAAYGGQSMMVAYAKEEMKHDDKLMSMRGNNRHFTRIVTAHELIPGHHLQNFVAGRNNSYRSLFSTPFLVEGWALYWEMRLWDLNFGETPEDRIGMLFWRMHRSARIIVSLKFHLGKMAPEEMVNFLVDRVGHEKLGATSEVRRFIGGDYSPVYQCGYMIGGLQLRALHQELVKPGKMSEREFHDTVLTYNAIPVELIRAGMRNLTLKRDTAPSWRFADAIKD